MEIIMTAQEQISFILREIASLNNAINEKIKELYEKGGKCFIGGARNVKICGPAPSLQITASDPGPNRNIQFL